MNQTLSTRPLRQALDAKPKEPLNFVTSTCSNPIPIVPVQNDLVMDYWKSIYLVVMHS
jgi:hypothetical protein